MPKRMSERLVAGLPGMAYRCLHDADWTLEFVSEGSLDLLGYSPDELVEQKKVAIADLIHPDDLAGVSLSVERALAERRPFRMSYRMRTSSGEERWIEELGRGVFDEAGELEALEGFLSDVTERRRAEEHLLRTQRRGVLDQLATGMAHDINNLLTVIVSCAATIAEGLDPKSPFARDAALIDEAAQRVGEMTKQLLALGGAHSTPSDITDVPGTIERQVQLLGELLRDDVRIRLALPGSPLLVRIDPSRLEQVTMNLVINARDALEDGGHVDITVAREGDQVLVRVEDDGAGMSREVQREVFDPFFTTKNEGRGTGLGLAVVHDIVASAGGTIELESAPGVGTTFSVRFPSLEGELPTSAGDLGVEVLLLVDDDDRLRDVMARALRRAGYTVLVAPNGREALNLSRRHKGPIHALVCDARMPVMGGVELAEAFVEERPEVPRMLISGDSIDIGEGLFAARLAKPFHPDELMRALRKLLDSPAT